jgi:hypothetical protein
MKVLGAITFLAGMFVFMSGWIFLDLASLPLKQDLYALDVLGFFNHLFSLDPRTASFQSILSMLFILMGCAICYAGSVMVRQR